MLRDDKPSRRSALRLAGAGALGALATGSILPELHADEPAKIKGNIRQSVCRWCYPKLSIEQLAAEAGKIGYKSIELLTPSEYLKLKPTGLTCAMIRFSSITKGVNRKENHEKIEKELLTNIDFAAAEKLSNIMVMSGNREGMSDEEGLDNCVIGLKRVIGHAEKNNITIFMELLNSKVNHPDYMCDRTKWGVDLVKKLGSDRFKMLYDIYHMQIMEGDVISTIKNNKDYIGHYHTAGVPGRHEIDDTQELNYPGIVKAILDTGFKGYLAQEFSPVRDPMTSLAQGFRICDV